MSYAMKSKLLQMKFKAFYDRPQFLNLMDSFNKHFKSATIKHQKDEQDSLCFQGTQTLEMG